MIEAFIISSMIGARNRFTSINNIVSSYHKLTTDPHLDAKKNGFVSPLHITCVRLTRKLGVKMCNTYLPIKIIVCSIVRTST